MSKNKPKHTPTPWKRGYDTGRGKQNEWTKIYSNTAQVAQISPIHPTGERQQNDFTAENANAEHIVHCVNSHDALVDALKGLLNDPDGKSCSNPWDNRVYAKQALKDAEE